PPFFSATVSTIRGSAWLLMISIEWSVEQSSEINHSKSVTLWVRTLLMVWGKNSAELYTGVMIEICGMHLCLYKDINMVHFISIYGIILENGLNITITYISTMKTKINGLFNAKQLQVVLKLPLL